MANCYNDCIHSFVCQYVNHDEYPSVQQLKNDCRCCHIGADVVPKSEVERLEEELSKANAEVKNYMKVAEYQQSLSVKRYHEIKRLKEDIERLEKTLDEYEETSGLKQAKAEVAREIFEEIERVVGEKYNHYVFGNSDLDSTDQDAIINFSDTLSDCFAELKKKYTEEQPSTAQNTCVSCGEMIPEGRQVCHKCERLV